jgi:hypothetical protein
LTDHPDRIEIRTGIQRKRKRSERDITCYIMSMNIIPVWGFFVGVIILVPVAIEMGYQPGWMTHQRRKDEKGKDD